MDPASQDINLNSPNKGLVVDNSDSLSDVPVETVVEGAVGIAANPLPPGLTEEEAEELRTELTKVEEEINTLRQVLSAKERHAADLKRKLGLSPLNELKQNFSKSWQDVQTSNAPPNHSVASDWSDQSLTTIQLTKRVIPGEVGGRTLAGYVRTTEKLGEWNERVTSLDLYLSASATLDDISRSEAYKKTQETLSQAGQKTSAALTTVGTVLSKRLGDMRNSATFKSFEDKMGNLKYKVVGPRGNGEAIGSPTDTTPTQENPPF